MGHIFHVLKCTIWPSQFPLSLFGNHNAYLFEYLHYCRLVWNSDLDLLVWVKFEIYAVLYYTFLDLGVEFLTWKAPHVYMFRTQFAVGPRTKYHPRRTNRQDLSSLCIFGTYRLVCKPTLHQKASHQLSEDYSDGHLPLTWVQLGIKRTREVGGVIRPVTLPKGKFRRASVRELEFDAFL